MLEAEGKLAPRGRIIGPENQSLIPFKWVDAAEDGHDSFIECM